jgi:hypothetical protein
MFTTPRPNVIQSDAGFSVEMVMNGHAALLRYAEGPSVIHAVVELLAGSPAAIALLRDTLFPAGTELVDPLPEGTKERVIENIRAAFRSQNQEIEIVSRV